MVDGNIWKVRIYHGYLQIYDTNSLPEMFRKIDNFSIGIGGFVCHSLEMTPAQLAEATELTVNYYQRHYYNFNQYFTRECGSIKVKFPKAIGAYVYEAYKNVPNLVDGSGEDFVYAGYNYEAYSTWEPTIRWYPGGLITIEGAYPKGLTLFVQTNTTNKTTTLGIRIESWAVQANSIPIIPPPNPWSQGEGYVHVDGYKLMRGDPSWYSEPQDYADNTYFSSNLPVAATITKTAYTSAIGTDGVGAVNE